MERLFSSVACVLVLSGHSMGSDGARACFSRGGADAPRESVYGATWGSSTAMPAPHSEAYWVVLRHSPADDAAALAMVDKDKRVSLMFRDGGSWSAPTEVCNDAGSNSDRPLDGGYERLSGDYLAVYWKKSARMIGYRTASNGTVSPEGILAPASKKDVRFVALAPRPSSDEVLVVVLDTKSDLHAWWWDGSKFGPRATICSTASTSGNECFSVAYEGLSGMPVVAYTVSDDTAPRYRTWTGGAWSAEQSLPASVRAARWVRLAGAAGSDRLMCAILDKNKDIVAVPWNGSSWGAAVTLEVDAKHSDCRQFDVAFEPDGGRAVVAWAKKNSDALRYRTWEALGGWSPTRTGPDLGGQPTVVALHPGASGAEVFVAASDEDRDLAVARWTGSTWVGHATLEGSLGGTMKTEAFMLGIQGRGGSSDPRLVRWREVDPR